MVKETTPHNVGSHPKEKGYADIMYVAAFEIGMSLTVQISDCVKYKCDRHDRMLNSSNASTHCYLDASLGGCNEDAF